MDLSQLLKLGIKIIHQDKPANRAQKIKEFRQQKRNDLVSQKRHITDSPLTFSPELPKKMEAKPTRLEMLKKWQEERNKRRAEEKAKKKPLFKVAHIKEDIYKEIVNLPPLSAKKEPTPSRYKFASSTHKFRLPSNIKPIHFKNDEGNGVQDKGKAVTKDTSQAAGNTRRKLNFKQETITENKIEQNGKGITRKPSNVSKPQPGTTTTKRTTVTSKVSITRSASINSHMVGVRPKLGHETKNTKPEVKTNNLNTKVSSKSRITQSGSDIAVSKIAKDSSNSKPKAGTVKASGSEMVKRHVTRSNSDVNKITNKSKPRQENDKAGPVMQKSQKSLNSAATVQRKSSTPKKKSTVDSDKSNSKIITPETDQKLESEAENDELNSTFNIEADSVANEAPEKESKSVEERDIPNVRTRAMCRAQQKSLEDSLENQLPDTVESKEGAKKSVSPRKKRQVKVSVDDEASKKSEFIVPASKTPKKEKSVANDERTDTNEVMDTKITKSIDKIKNNRRKSLHLDAPVTTTIKTPTYRRSLSSNIKIFVDDIGITSFTNDASFKSMSPDYPLESSFEAPPLNEPSPAVQNPDVTPDNKQAITYVSPYVTMSRGKNSARKEYHKRQSKGGLCEASPDVTGVKAGAAYFYKVLDDEILRIQNMCQEWTIYKDENDLPEEACDMINTALGQSGLLISKRMNQFRGLIDSCDAQNTDPLITCMDLHGYWDLLLIQVKNLDSRFDNLTNIRSNNWEEVLPEKKTVEVKLPAKRPGRKAKAAAKSSSSIRNAIKAARLKAQTNADQQNVFDGGFFAVKSPRKTVPEKTPLKGRKSLLQVVLTSDVKTVPSSPGLAICRATRKSRSIGTSIKSETSFNTVTPVKSILKSREAKSSVKKAVIFEEDLDEGDAKNKSYVISSENNENDANSPNLVLIDEPARRSSRLSRNRLF